MTRGNLEDEQETWEFLLKYANLCGILDNDEKALELLNELLNTLNWLDKQNSSQYADCLYLIAWSHYWKFRNAQVEAEKESQRNLCLQNLNSSKQLYKALGMNLKEAKCVRLEERIIFDQNEYIQSINLSKQRLELSTKSYFINEESIDRISQLSEIGDCYRNIAESNGYIRNRNEQQSYYYRTLDIYQKIEAEIQIKIAFCHKKLSMFRDNSVDEAIIALEMYENLHNAGRIEDKALISARQYLGDAYKRTGNKTLARKQFVEALRLFDNQTDEYKQDQENQELKQKLIEKRNSCDNNGDDLERIGNLQLLE